MSYPELKAPDILRQFGVVVAVGSLRQDVVMDTSLVTLWILVEVDHFPVMGILGCK